MEGTTYVRRIADLFRKPPFLFHLSSHPGAVSAETNPCLEETHRTWSVAILASVYLPLTAALTVLLVALGTFIHYEVLRHCNELIPRLDWVAGRAKVLLAMGAAFCSHLAQIALFAGAYWLVNDTAMGSLSGQIHTSPMGFLYFSVETYTSLGFGDVYPTGTMRLLAGMEALTGLLMISWTASFTYLEMRRHWLVPER